jgi:hypothetical protein
MERGDGLVEGAWRLGLLDRLGRRIDRIGDGADLLFIDRAAAPTAVKRFSTARRTCGGAPRREADSETRAKMASTVDRLA